MSDSDHNPPDLDDNELDLAARVLVLEMDVQKIVRSMESEAEQARRALTIYPRARALASRLIGAASHHQSRARRLGLSLQGCADRLKLLEAEVHESDEGKTLRRDLQQIRQILRRWQVHSDDLG